MCLVVFAWNMPAHDGLVLVGHRDEFHARPAAPMDWWNAPRLLGGRDLVAGGTWLGFADGGRFGGFGPWPATGAVGQVAFVAALEDATGPVGVFEWHNGVLRRLVLLVLLGMVYNGALNLNGFQNTMYASVLGMIGVGWFFAALICLCCGVRAQAAWAAGILRACAAGIPFAW